MKLSSKLTGTSRGRSLLAVVGGLLLSAAFPKMGWSLLAFVALVPLLAAVRGVGGREAFRLGMLFGVAHYLSLLYWVVITMRTYGYLPWWQCISLLVLLAAYLALYPGLFAASVAGLCKTPGRLVLLAPVFWLASEYARTFLMTGFPWGLVGYSQFNQLHIIQISDMFGVYGVSFLVVLVNAGLYVLGTAVSGSSWQGQTMGRRRAWLTGGALVLAIGSTITYGHLRMQTMDAAMAQAPTTRVALVQGNIDQASKWDPAFQVATTRKYLDLTRATAPYRPDLVVWPETAMPFYFTVSPRLSQLVSDGVRQTGVHLLMGSPSVEGAPRRQDYFNSAYLVNPEGIPAGRYDKVHLVPFGEYVPFKQILSFAGKMVAQVGDFASGEEGRTLAWGPQRPDIGVQICFEIIFPGLSRSLVANGAGLLVNLTNDAWFDRSSAAYQHFSMAVFRAVENRRSLARCANTGISGFIDPVGRVVTRTGLFENAVVARPLPHLTTTTIYTRWGDLLPLVCLGAWLALAGRALFGPQGPGLQQLQRLAGKMSGKRS